MLATGALVLTIRDAHKFANPYICFGFKLLLIAAAYLSLEDVQLRMLVFLTHVILMHLWNQLIGDGNNFVSLLLMIGISILNIFYIILIVTNLYGVILYILYSVWCGALLLWNSQLGEKENVLPLQQQQPQQPRLVTSTPPKIKVLSSFADGLGGRKTSRNEIRLSIK